MKKFRRILPIFLALVMCVTSILPVYATGDVTTTSTKTAGSFSTTNGYVIFEAEEAELNKTLVTKKGNTAASNGYVVEMTANENYKDNPPDATMVAGVSFNVVPDKSATYYVWLRISSKSSTDSAWCSVDGAEYTQVKPNVGAQNSNTFGWKNIATVDATEGKEFNLRYRPREMKALWDKIVVTSDENFDPTSLSEYVIKFIDYDSTVLSSAVCLENEIINIPSNPTRTEDDNYTYTFEGWKLYNTETNQVEGEYLTSSTTVTGDATYQAMYSATDAQPLYVAQVGDVNYTTLDEAIGAATAGSTITLLDDCTLSSSDYDEAITYDLNGHTLTADAFTGINATVVDSSNGNNGLLKIPQDKLVFDINNDNDGYIPVWDRESNGYRFSSVTISDIEYDSSDALVFAMRPAFDSSNIEKLVAEGHETGKVRVGVRITWPGSDKPYDLPLSDDWLSTMYGGEIAKGVKLTISGGKTITEFTATTIVWSEQCPYVVIAGTTTHTYSAIVE